MVFHGLAGFFLVPFVLTLFITPLVIRLAHGFGCIDGPGKRKFHDLPTPLWGGLAFFAGVLPVLVYFFINDGIKSYLFASVLFVILGAVDDYRPLGWKIKLVFMLLSSSIIIFAGGVVVRNIGVYGSYGKIELGIFSIVFTYISIIGVTNAINLMDGLNGLAGGLSMVAFLFIGIAAYISGNYVLVDMCAAFAGAMVAFLWYNFPKAKIFMGDSGSLFLGFSLAVFSILLTQNPAYNVNPIFPVLVLVIPIFDTLRVMTVRVFSLRNPFRADKIHIHHLLVRRGASPVNTVILLWSLSIIVCLAAIKMNMIKRTSTPALMMILFIALIFSIFAESLASKRRPKTP